jgi:hypothetical protein
MTRQKLLKESGGFTVVEVMFVAITVVMIISAILGIWILAQRTWTAETVRTGLRVDTVKALETMRKDIRLSSLTYMSFYPSGDGPYSAMSLPLAISDSDGFFSMNAAGEIDWDQTVVYHLFTDGDGEVSLRRTVIDPRDNSMDKDQRYDQLEAIALSGESEDEDALTDAYFLRDVDAFEISPLSSVIDFYENEATEVRRGKVLFGWVRLASGNHTIRFEITGKNDASSGYSIGLDSVMIEPSGSVREAEYYISSHAPTGMAVSGGGTAERVHGLLWSNDNYLEFNADGEGSYVEIDDYYDLWRESAFENVALDNTRKDGEEVRIKLDVPRAFESLEDADESQNIRWFAHQQAGDTEQGGHDGYVNPADPGSAPSEAVTVRTRIKRSHVDLDTSSDANKVDLVRVKFSAADSGDLRIERAYITRRDMASSAEYDGLTNLSPGGTQPEVYHRHQQLFFRDVSDIDTDGDTEEKIAQMVITSSLTERSVWSEWTAFPLVVEESDGSEIDYFVTFVLEDVSKAECKYWLGDPDNTYYFPGVYDPDSIPAEGTPDWSGTYVTEPETSDGIFAVAELDTWRSSGTAESRIFDTGVFSPLYGQIKWSEDNPTGTSVSVKARSHSDANMSGAAPWGSVADLSIDGTARYLQFLASLSADPFWDSGSDTLGYGDYIDLQLGMEDHQFPEDGGSPYTTAVNIPWIDDVEIDWPGTERICAITGYVAKRSDYGQAKLTVNGEDLVKILSIRVKATKDSFGRMINAENYLEVEPRNTGK